MRRLQPHQIRVNSTTETTSYQSPIREKSLASIKMDNLKSKLTFLTAILLVAFISCQSSLSECRRSRSQPLNRVCQQEECQLSSSHFALYSYLKQALDSRFDVSGKDLVPLIRAYQVLKIRFPEKFQSNESLIISKLLNNQTLQSAMQVLNSPDGRSLLNIYRSSINGRKQNLACSEFRIEEIEKATALLKSNVKLNSVFANVHRNFVKKSAKKCLKHSCTSIDISMSRLDSVLGKRALSSHKYHKEHHKRSIDVNVTDEMRDTDFDLPVVEHREFEPQEEELCKFLKKTNQSECQISANEMSEISFIKSSGANETTKLDEHLNAYQVNLRPETATDKSSALKQIVTQCGAFEGLLDYNLLALKWYQKQTMIEDEKLNIRSFWCPALAYWLQMDRLCEELTQAGL